MSIEHKAISALKWAAAARLVVQLASWAGTLVVVRLLAPEDYGLMAKVSVVCAIASAVAELGLEAAIVRSGEISAGDLRRLYGVSLLLSAAITLAVMALAPAMALLFRDARLTSPIAVASLQIMVNAIAIIPSALATRDLSFKRLSTIEMAAGIVGIAVTLALALWGAGVWSLVAGNLAGAFTRSTALLAVGERVRPLFSMDGISEHLKFGLTVAGNRVTYFVLSQSDVLIGSLFLSTTDIGRYAVALQLATLPMSKVMGIINQVTMPAVARQQDDAARVREVVLKAIGVISLFAFPALWGISAVAPELVEVLFGERWLGAVPALVILPIIVPVRMICSVLFTTSLALGNRRLDLRNTIANFILLPTGFFIGAQHGLVGLSLAWLVSVPLAYTVSIPGVLRAIGIRAAALVGACGPPAVAAAIMVGAVTALRAAAGASTPFLRLALLVPAGAAVYFAVIALISRRHLATALAFARAMVKRRGAEAA